MPTDTDRASRSNLFERLPSDLIVTEGTEPSVKEPSVNVGVTPHTIINEIRTDDTDDASCETVVTTCNNSFTT